MFLGLLTEERRVGSEPIDPDKLSLGTSGWGGEDAFWRGSSVLSDSVVGLDIGLTDMLVDLNNEASTSDPVTAEGVFQVSDEYVACMPLLLLSRFFIAVVAVVIAAEVVDDLLVGAVSMYRGLVCR